MNKKKGSPERENAVKAKVAKKSNCIFIDENLKWWSAESKGRDDDAQFEIISEYPMKRFNEECVAQYNKYAPCLLLFNGTGAISIIPIKKGKNANK